MAATLFPSKLVVVLRKRASILEQELRCPLCNKLLCIAQVLCIIEIKCTRSTCGVIVRIEPSERDEGMREEQHAAFY